MPRINNIGLDTDVTKDDKLLGSDSGGSTKSYTLKNISTFLKETNAAGVAAQLTYKYDTSTGQASGHLDSPSVTNLETSSTRTIRISVYTYGNTSDTRADLIDALSLKDIIIVNVDDPNNFGVYNVTSISTSGDYKTLTLSVPIAAKGSFTNTKTYAIAAYGGGSGDLTAIQTTTSNQLTITNGNGPIPSLALVTGTVADSGTALATGDQIHTFVTGGGYALGGTFTVGVDDTGHDVKFFGAASGQYMLWDESDNKLIVTGETTVGSLKTSGVYYFNGNNITHLSNANLLTGFKSTTGFRVSFDGGLTDAILFENSSVTGSLIKDEDNMSSNSATHLATQQSIKAYVDSQVDTVDTLSEILAIGNNTGGTKIEVNNTSGGIDFIDNAKLRLGTGDDNLEIYQDGTNSFIQVRQPLINTTAGTLYINAPIIDLGLDPDTTEDGDVRLRNVSIFTGSVIKDEDNMASNSSSHLATQQSIKAYVDAQIATEDTIAELNDTTIGTLANGHLLLYDNDSSVWENKALSGDATITKDGVLTLGTVYSGSSSVGSSTAIPVLTIDGKGRITGTSTASISSTLTVGADSGSNDTVTIGTDTLDFSGGTGIDTTVSDNDISIAIDSTVTTLTGSQTLTNKTLTSPILNTGVSGTAIKDEDNMASNSATHLATQQSIKAYVDAATPSTITVAANNSTDETVYPLFVDGATGAQDAETDTGLTYNPSSGRLTSTSLSVESISATNNLTTALIQLQGNLNILNKAQTSYIGLATRNTSGSEVVYDLTNVGNITTSGYLRGPASFTIDPSAHGDNTGTVVIAGNLQVDGTTTTINSTTVAIDDLNFSIATDAADSAAANGAGITVGGASATLLYTHATTSWDMNKPLNVTGNVASTGDMTIAEKLIHSGDTNTYLQFSADDNLKLYAGGKIYFHAHDNGSLYLSSNNSTALTFDTSQDATFTGDVTAGASDTAAKFKAFHSDGAYTEQSGTGLVLSRGNSYIQSSADNSTTLNIGQSSVRWGHVKVDSATFKVLNGGTERMYVNSSGNTTFSGDVLAKTSDGAILNLQTSDTTVTDGSVLGSIQFNAPDEASGTDALLTGAEIVAVAEGTFAADNNATELLFKVGASEAAATALTIASTKHAIFSGNIGLGAATSPNRLLHIDNTNSTSTASAYFYTNAQHTGVDTQAHVSIYSDHASSTGNVLHVRGDGTGDLFTLNKGGSDLLVVEDDGKATFSGLVSTGGATNATGAAKLHVADGTGAGLEVIPQTGNDRVTLLSYDRNSTAYQTLDFDGSDVHFNISGSEKARLDSNGRLGLGQTSLTYALEVINASYDNIAWGASSAVGILTQQGSNPAFKTVGNLDIVFYANNNLQLTIDDGSATFAGDVLLGSSKGLYTNVVQAVSSAGLKLGNDDNSQYIFIKDDTGVGIGTTSPQEKLHIYSTGNTRFEVESTTNVAGLKVTNNSGSYAWYVPAGTDNFRLYDFTDSADRITVDGDGNTTFSGEVTVGVDDTGYDVKLFGATSGRYMLWDESEDKFIVSDDVEFAIGSGGYDLRLKHTGGNSFITNNVGNLTISVGTTDGDLILMSDDGSGGETAYITLDGGVGYTIASKDIRFNDSISACFGTGIDAFFNHNGSHFNFFNDIGDVNFTNRTDDGDIIFASDNGSGGTKNYFILDGGDGNTRFEVDARHLDSVKAKFGTGNDLQLYHDGSNSFITNDTGYLDIIQNADDSHIRFFTDDGSGGTEVYLTIDGNNQYIRFDKDARFDDNEKIELGIGGDFQLYHTGSDSYVKHYTGTLYIEQHQNDGNIRVYNDDGSGGIAEYIRVDGTNHLTAFHKNVKLHDNVELLIGSGTDLQLYHTGTISYIRNNTGNLEVRNQTSGASDIIFKTTTSDPSLDTFITLDGSLAFTTIHKTMRFDDSVELRLGTGNDLKLYHDGNNSYMNNSTGNLTIVNETNDGDIIFQSDDGSGGVAEYFRVDGANSSGSSKFTSWPDGSKVSVGTGLDAQFYHSGSHTYIENSTGNLELIQNTDNGDIVFKSDDGSGGTTAYLTIDGTNERILADKHVNLVDSAVLQLGSSQDLRLYHNGSHSWIQDMGTGGLYIETNGPAIYLRDTDGNYMAQFTDGGAVFLAHNAVTKFETTSAGITVTGDILAKTSDGAKLTLQTSEATVVDGDVLGRIDFQAPDESGGTDAILVGASIWAEADATFAYDQNTTELVFATGASEAATEKVRITSDGKVGINTATPSYKFQVEDTTASDNKTIAYFAGTAAAGSSTDDGGQFICVNRHAPISQANGVTGGIALGTSTVASGAHVRIQANYKYNSGRDMQFLTSADNSTSPVERMVIKGGGDIGIGTASPNRKLEVSSGGSDVPQIRAAYDTSNYIDIKHDIINKVGGSSFALQFGGSNALTFDSSQNATFEGALVANLGNGKWRVNSYGAMYFRNSSNATHESYIHSRSDGSLSIGRVAESDWTGSGNNAYAATTHDHVKFDTSSNATFTGNVTAGNSSHGQVLHGSKAVTLTENTFTTALTVNLAAHTACYVKIFVTGNWSGHSAVNYLGEYFLTNGNDDNHNEPGMIIREVDNTKTDTIVAKIVDPAASGAQNFIIQLKADDTVGSNDVSAKITYEVMGQYVSVT